MDFEQIVTSNVNILMSTITVLIPTYRRPQDLSRCLEALKKQDELPNEVLVTVRDTDLETWEFLKTFNSQPLPLKIVKVIEPGVLAALTAGFSSAQGDIIATVDDDAAPHPDWLKRIKAHFLSDSTIGGVGGRDFLYTDGERFIDNTQQIVGQIQWCGNVVGNHHLGVGEAREVDVLKGVNSSYRRAAIKDFHFDKHLRISGRNTHYELALGLYVKKAGWKLIYDPKVAVDHYPGKRFQMADRKQFDSVGIRDTAYNQTIILMKYLSPQRRLIFIIWAILVGTRGRRGFVQCLLFLPQEGILSFKQLTASVMGRLQGWQTWKQSN